MKVETDTTCKRTSKSQDSQTSTSGNSPSTNNENPQPKRLFTNSPTSYTPSAPRNAIGKLFDTSYWIILK